MLYTRKGDDGLTDLADGTRSSKCAPRIECAGQLDELNSYLGLIVSLLPAETHSDSRQIAQPSSTPATASAPATQPFDEVRTQLLTAQRFIFSLGAWAAACPAPPQMPTADDVRQLEQTIDRYARESGYRFTGFILPGGHPLAAHIDVARTLCRKAERGLFAAGADEWEHAAEALPYMNRLSDFLYILARKINWMMAFEEIKWQAIARI